MKKWIKDEIKQIVNMREKGVKFKNIGLFFLVTGNAVRKALQRHTNFYSKLSNNFNKNQTSKIDIIQWGIKYSIFIKHNIGLLFNNNIISEDHAILLVNKYRLKNGLLPFLVKNN